MLSRRRAAVTACCAVLGLIVGGCTNDVAPAAEAPTPQPTTTTPAGPSQIVVGVDGVGGGYNPHKLADLSPVTTALAQLLLPSVFRPDHDGRLVLDETFMTSAEVVSDTPFTVAYEIRRDASWSDGAPIAAEDFSYLANVMRSQPGMVDPAGYRLIEDVSSRGGGGKRVEVTFSEPYPGWRSLFGNLLPAHLLKDAPGGWSAALSSSFPAYGGPFAIKSLDSARGEIQLERNERYWEKPAAVDQILLRRQDQRAIVDGLRGGNDQFALTRADDVGISALEGLGDRVKLHTIPRNEVAEVVLRPTGDTLSDDDVRGAVAALIDRDDLIEAGIAGGPSEGLRADAQIHAPSSAGYAPNVPTRYAQPGKASANRLLRESGYRHADGAWVDADGDRLAVVIASPGKREPYSSVANELADQLSNAGIAARVVTPPARDLFAIDPADPDAEPVAGTVDIDILVGPRAVGTDPAASLASRFACRVDEEDDDGTASVPGNAAGFCDEKLQATLADVLTGERALPEAAAAVERALWRANVTIPLFQVADTLALGNEVVGVTPGPPLVGPFHSAVNWIRTGG